MRTSVGAFALIRHRAPGGADEWLCNWNPGWHALNLVGGHKRTTESFRDCCQREAAEELDLAPGSDFRVAPDRECRLEYVADSRRSGEKTAYTLEVFRVDLLTDAARAQVEADPQCAWLDERLAEVRTLRQGLRQADRPQAPPGQAREQEELDELTARARLWLEVTRGSGLSVGIDRVWRSPGGARPYHNHNHLHRE